MTETYCPINSIHIIKSTEEEADKSDRSTDAGLPLEEEIDYSKEINGYTYINFPNNGSSSTWKIGYSKV